MPNIQLSICISDNDRTRPVIEGRAKPDGIDLAVSTAHPSEMFWRQLHYSEFDISEMSVSSLLMARAVKSNRTILEAMTGFSHEQGLTPRQFKLDEVFAPQTLDL